MGEFISGGSQYLKGFDANCCFCEIGAPDDSDCQDGLLAYDAV